MLNVRFLCDNDDDDHDSFHIDIDRYAKFQSFPAYFGNREKTTISLIFLSFEL